MKSLGKFQEEIWRKLHQKLKGEEESFQPKTALQKWMQRVAMSLPNPFLIQRKKIS